MDQQPEAVAVLEAAIQQVQARARQFQQPSEGQAAPPKAVTAAPPYLPANRFEGRRPGYYFSRGVRGVG